MKLQEVFEQLTFGELSQISMGGGEQGVIAESNYRRIMPHITLGLLALYKRFPLKEGKLILGLVEGTLSYSLSSKNAVANPRYPSAPKYIQDTSTERFKDDLLKVERVYTEAGYEMSINDKSDVYSLNTPTSHILVVPEDIVEQKECLPFELKTETLEVFYRANHPAITNHTCFFDAERIELELPYSHLEPLLLFVASRVHTPTGMTNEMNMGNTYFAKYEASCQQLENTNLRVDQNSQNTRLRENGWV